MLDQQGDAQGTLKSHIKAFRKKAEATRKRNKFVIKNRFSYGISSRNKAAIIWPYNEIWVNILQCKPKKSR